MKILLSAAKIITAGNQFINHCCPPGSNRRAGYSRQHEKSGKKTPKNWCDKVKISIKASGKDFLSGKSFPPAQKYRYAYNYLVLPV